MTESDAAAPGPLLGRGRAADVYDIGHGRVLRRNRNRASTAREAEVMQHVRAHGYPAPEVFDHEAGDLVMERLDGPTMLQAFGSRPWGLRGWAQMLAVLHLRLEDVPIPDIELDVAAEPGEVIAHGDLHPDNVILTETGPVVIDWPNASLAPKGFDAAHTWVLMATSDLEGGPFTTALERLARGYFVRRFVDQYGREQASGHLSAAAARRLLDHNVRPNEADAIRALVPDLRSRP